MSRIWLLAMSVSACFLVMGLGTSAAYATGAEPASETAESPEEQLTAQAISPTVGTCTAAVGATYFKINTEREWLENAVYTNLAHKQKLVFKSHGETLRLTKLTRATCFIKTWDAVTASVFNGGGEATWNGEPGYTVGFSISITQRGQVILNLRIYKGREKVARYNYVFKNMEAVG